MTTLLLIDDNLDCARMVSKILTPLGYTMLHAENGLTGLQLARRTEPGLILLDINLPDLNGNVVVLQLRAARRFASIPIVAFTAEDVPKAKRVAMALGCDGFLSKPIDPRMFPTQIDDFLRLKQSLSCLA